MDLRNERLGWLTRAEWGVCVGATLVALVLHVIFLTHAGGLWRDEVSTVALANFPTVGEMWRLLGRDSFPALFPAILRCWSTLGFGGSDLSLRLVGFLIGLLVFLALWLSAKSFGHNKPLISLALLAVNTTLLRWGDSLRATGLACALIILTFAAIWWLICAPSPRRFLVTSLLAILSVNCLYQNAFLLLAICGAAFAVCFRCQQNKAALWVLAVGAVAAVSLLPYAGIVTESQRWYAVQQTGFNAPLVIFNLFTALGSPLWVQNVVWVGVCLLALVLGLATLRTPARRKRIGPDELPLYACLGLAFGLFGFFFFLVLAKLPTQPWYWLPPITLVAVCADAALARLPDRLRSGAGVPPAKLQEYFRTVRLAVCALMICLPLVPAIKSAKLRQTSIDLAAAVVSQQAKPGDFIAVYPWYHAVTFTRYYHGSAPWTAIPPLSDTRIHRYDLIKEQLAATAPIQPVLDKISETLAAGNRVWIVGQLPLLATGQDEPAPLPPAPEGPWGWHDNPYNYVWGRETQRFLAHHADRIENIPLNSPQPINRYEDAPLILATGLNLHP